MVGLGWVGCFVTCRPSGFVEEAKENIPPCVYVLWVFLTCFGIIKGGRMGGISHLIRSYDRKNYDTSIYIIL